MAPPAFIVQAQVVDIRIDNPKATDAFLVDTNVWFWTAYTRATLGPNPPAGHQLAAYPPYLAKTLAAKAVRLRCGLCLAELAHLVEKTEREIYEIANRVRLQTKEYRHNFSAERANVVAEIQAAWGQVKSTSDLLPVTIDDPTSDAALARFQTQPLDGYDLFILEGMSSAKVAQVLTDDGDYCTVPGIEVFTANRNVISAATAQGKLWTR